MTDHVEATRQGAGLRLHENTPEDRHRAALYVASRATDRNDARELLQALGLIDSGRRWKASIHTRRRKAVGDG